jgi:hypothetical protein
LVEKTKLRGKKNAQLEAWSWAQIEELKTKRQFVEERLNVKLPKVVHARGARICLFRATGSFRLCP